MKKKSLFSKIYPVLVFGFLYAPIAVLILFSFNSGKSTAVFEGFSLRWYEEVFRDTATLEAFKNTVIVAVVSAVVSTVMGTAAAIAINNYKLKWFKQATLTTTNIPMMNPDIVTGISMMLLFVFIGALFGKTGTLGFTTLTIAHVTFELPYVILNVLPKLRQTDIHLSEAAQDLGCDKFKVFKNITIPLSLPGVVSGFTMVFVPSVSTFYISQKLGGTGTTLIGDIIETQFQTANNFHLGASLSFVLMILIFICLAVMNKFSDDDGEVII